MLDAHIPRVRRRRRTRTSSSRGWPAAWARGSWPSKLETTQRHNGKICVAAP